MVPEGWERTKLGQLVSIKHGYAFSSEYFSSDGEYALLTPGNFYDSGGYRDLREKQKFFNGPIPEEYVLQEGDMLVAMTEQAAGLLGSTMFVPSGIRYLHNQRLGLIKKLKGSLVDLAFLHSLMSTEELRKRISSESGGTKVKHTSPAKLLNLDLLLPPLSEQKKIAEILSTWDRAIEVAERQLENARLQKKALMQQLLTGTRRLPGFDGEWKTALFSQICQRGKERFDPKRETRVQPCIELEHIEPETGRILKCGSTEHMASTKSVFQTSDVLFGKLRPYLKKFAFPKSSGVCTSEIWVLRSQPKLIISAYLYLIVQSEGFIATASKSSGTKMPRAEWSVVGEYIVKLPTLEEQHAIAAVFGGSDCLISALTDKLTHLRTEKRALMQQLLTGRKRVTV